MVVRQMRGAGDTSVGTDAGPRVEAEALAPGPSGLVWRHPTGDDHAGLVELVDDWFGGRRVHAAFGRFLLEHFGSTSLLAATPEANVAGYLVGLVSPDHPDQALVHTAAVDPNLRRRGIGRELYRRFGLLARARNATELVALVWPGDPIAVRFHRALGFEPRGGHGAMPLYGTLAWPDYEFRGEDRVIFTRRIGEHGEI
jgi:ribosomal protein S18 acetylase RimI-like enzyme